ncbi:hypothetical protein [Streptomyces sp. NPDC050738]
MHVDSRRISDERDIAITTGPRTITAPGPNPPRTASEPPTPATS